MHPDPVHTLPLQAVQKLLLLSHNRVNILSQSNTEHSYDNIQEMFLPLFLFNWHDIPPIICIEIDYGEKEENRAKCTPWA